MIIRKALPSDREVLVDIWLRSVRATHTFLTEQDIQGLLAPTRTYLTSAESELWVLASDAGDPVGFMGMSGSEIEALFLAPELLRRGGGRLLVDHARKLSGGDLTVSVNEQNNAARRFYEACGFVVESRSDLDGDGRPFPLLHMRRRDLAIQAEEDAPHVVQFLEDRLYEHNSGRTHAHDGRLFARTVRGERGDIIAGIAGWTWAGACEITQLWVSEEARSKGLGKLLLQEAEAEAVRRQCRIVLVKSYSFQAPSFYEKHGYRVAHVVEGFPPGHRSYTLVKSI